MKLADDAARQQFIHDHRTNFSVIAPAGVGKTTAIVARILSIIQKNSIPPDQLYVVTYTQKAAQELHDRTLQQLFQKKIDINALEPIFFGTIHALADRLLRRNGTLIGLPFSFQVETSSHALWRDFFDQAIAMTIPEPFCAFITRDMIERLVQAYPDTSFHTEVYEIIFPRVDWNPLLEFPAKQNRTITEFQKNLRRWLQNPSLPFPPMTSTAREFVALYRSVIEPVEEACARYFQQQYEALRDQFTQFRLQNGRLTYADLIHFARHLLTVNPPRDGAYVLLDEAQDTDPEQFQLLLQLAQGKDFDSGHFCMVGDPQQSIYPSRADVHFYQNLYQRLAREGVLQELAFSVTMRFPKKIAEHVNRVFQPLFEHSEQQVSFVPITAYQKTTTSAWQCVRTHQPDGVALNALFEGKQPIDFGVKHWSEIAILAPRRAWLQELQSVLSIKTQLHSATTTYRTFREFAWIEALIEYLWDPTNTFELAGILREIFGWSDAAIVSAHEHSPLDELPKNLVDATSLTIVDTFLETFELRDRIFSIQGFYHNNIERTVMCLAAQNPTLLDFKNQLKKLAAAAYEPENVDANALQLYTFHKAKGLEWPIVIIPFINREPYPAPATFPNLVRNQVVLNKAQQERSFSDLPLEDRNNTQRLLYVALTRQRQKTIFIDDGARPTSNSLKNILENGNPFFEMLPVVGDTGLEPVTSCVSCKRSNQLS